MRGFLGSEKEGLLRHDLAAAVRVGDYVYIEGGEMSQKLGDKTLPPDQAHTKSKWFRVPATGPAPFSRAVQ